MHTAVMAATVRASVALGDLPGWIGALSTFLGLVAAGFAAWYVRGQLIEMRRQADANGEELARQRIEWAETDRIRARDQAVRIDVAPEKHPADLPGIGSHTYWTLVVKNTSNRPIYGVRFRANVKAAYEPMATIDERVGRIRDIGNGPYFFQDAELQHPLPVLRRDAEVAFLVPTVTDLYPNPKFWIQFSDDAGSLWELDSDMHLRPISERWVY
jgi:hypothetical protein